ncbi:MAG TPA: cobalamin biosynthesis protein CbiG [Desulfobulbaceae bacterium]|nr:MAG: cobalamin biosynthesis protein CbiG [Deltaproteobacteria bacterium RIFOXYD12_FULL_53_23]HCC54678.1 cobalamin biosynthesis protein CbiG [Desulfobulbaceae bacterium]
MKIGILSITEGGRRLATELAAKMPDALLLPKENGVARTLAAHWREMDGFICIMAAGIVVRAIAPLLQDKESDPCVVVLDEKGHHAVSLLSGHLGGGNDLARQVAALVGGEAVLTTASDTLGLAALDLWARDQDLVCEDKEGLTRASARLVNTGSLGIYAEVAIASLPQGLAAVAGPELADIVISPRIGDYGGAVVFRPKNLVLGVGCNRGAPVAELRQACEELFAEQGLSRLSIRNLASIDLKQDEAGLLAFAEEQGWRLEFFSKEELNRVENVTVSEAALRNVGAVGVAEPAALLSAQSNDLLVGKRKWRNVTMAVARANFMLSAQDRAPQDI